MNIVDAVRKLTEEKVESRRRDVERLNQDWNNRNNVHRLQVHPLEYRDLALHQSLRAVNDEARLSLSKRRSPERSA